MITGDRYRVIEVADPVRERDPSGYREAVADWHARRAAAYAEVIARELPDGGTLGFLVWGDPAFYDSTLRIVEQIRGSGIDLTLEVYPGISSVQLLAARHQLILNTVGGSIHVTTGRRLVEEFDPSLGTVVVMLDGDLACAGLVEQHPGSGDLVGCPAGADRRSPAPRPVGRGAAGDHRATGGHPGGARLGDGRVCAPRR